MIQEIHQLCQRVGWDPRDTQHCVLEFADFLTNVLWVLKCETILKTEDPDQPMLLREDKIGSILLSIPPSSETDTIHKPTIQTWGNYLEHTSTSGTQVPL